jgi:hypothetical protein
MIASFIIHFALGKRREVFGVLDSGDTRPQLAWRAFISRSYSPYR